MKPNRDGPRCTVEPGIGELGWFGRTEQALGEGVIEECQITAGVAMPFSSTDFGPDATRVSYGPHHQCALSWSRHLDRDNDGIGCEWS
jgi:hypothetical protein